MPLKECSCRIPLSVDYCRMPLSDDYCRMPLSDYYCRMPLNEIKNHFDSKEGEEMRGRMSKQVWKEWEWSIIA